MKENHLYSAIAGQANPAIKNPDVSVMDRVERVGKLAYEVRQASKCASYVLAGICPEVNNAIEKAADFTLSSRLDSIEEILLSALAHIDRIKGTL